MIHSSDEAGYSQSVLTLLTQLGRLHREGLSGDARMAATLDENLDSIERIERLTALVEARRIGTAQSAGNAASDILRLCVCEGGRTARSNEDAFARFKTECHSRDTRGSSAQGDDDCLLMVLVRNRAHQRIVWTDAPIAGGIAPLPRAKVSAKGTFAGLIPVTASSAFAASSDLPNLPLAIRINDLISTQQADLDRSGN
jgi:hypothetical protein